MTTDNNYFKALDDAIAEADEQLTYLTNNNLHKVLSIHLRSKPEGIGLTDDLIQVVTNAFYSGAATHIKELEVSVKNVYGKDIVYPECDTSKLLAQLSGHRTLTGDAISILKNLGYTFAPITKEI